MEPATRPRLECRRETGLILRCVRKVGNPFSTKQGSRPSCRDQEGRKGSEEVVPKTSVFLSRETGISGNSVGRIKGAKYRFDLQFLMWDFSGDAVAAQGYILRCRGNHVVFLVV